MKKSTKRNPAEISLFPDFEAELAAAEAERERQRIKAEREAAWREQESRFFDWLFDDNGKAEAAQRCTCPGKIITIINVDATIS